MSPRNPLHTALFTLLALATATAFGHAELESSTPENGETLGTAPTQVELVFSESVEVAFSTFKVYPLPAELAASVADDAMHENMIPLDDSDDSASDDSSDDTSGDDHGSDDSGSDDHGDDAATEGEDHHGAGTGGSALETFVAEHLAAENDSAERVDSDVNSQGNQITIDLTDDLTEGAYVVMWSALSADEHPIEGYVTFIYTP